VLKIEKSLFVLFIVLFEVKMLTDKLLHLRCTHCITYLLLCDVNFLATEYHLLSLLLQTVFAFVYIWTDRVIFCSAKLNPKVITYLFHSYKTDLGVMRKVKINCGRKFGLSDLLKPNFGLGER